MRRTFTHTLADPFARALVDLLTHLAEQSTWAGAPYCHTVEIGLPLGAEGLRRVIIIKVTRAYNHSNSRQPVVRRAAARNEKRYPTTPTQLPVPSHLSARTLAKD